MQYAYYTTRMTTSILRSARFALLLAAGFVLGAIAITVASASSGKSGLLQTLGISGDTGALAAASCDDAKQASSEEVYFVSCGGFF